MTDKDIGFTDEDLEFILRRVFYTSGALEVKKIEEAHNHINDILDKYHDKLMEFLQK